MCIHLKEVKIQNSQMEDLVDKLRQQNSKYLSVFKSIASSASKKQMEFLSKFNNNIIFIIYVL